jgi:hypothetical protein
MLVERRAVIKIGLSWPGAYFEVRDYDGSSVSEIPAEKAERKEERRKAKTIKPWPLQRNCTHSEIVLIS